MIEEKCCNCRNSKCMKLYCQCFAARINCGKSCHCIDCHNTPLNKQIAVNGQSAVASQRRPTRQELLKTHKGCACRKSGCTKKYCECFQAGIACKDSCKCIDWQQLITIEYQPEQLVDHKQKSDQPTTPYNSIIQSQWQYPEPMYSLFKLDPLYLSQNNQHLSSIMAENNPLNLQNNWLQKCANILSGSTLQQQQRDNKGIKDKNYGSIDRKWSTANILIKFLDIIDQLDKSTGLNNIEPLSLQPKKSASEQDNIKVEQEKQPINEVNEDSIMLQQPGYAGFRQHSENSRSINRKQRNIILPGMRKHESSQNKQLKKQFPEQQNRAVKNAEAEEQKNGNQNSQSNNNDSDIHQQ